MAALRIGVDVGGTKIEAIALDARMCELLRRRVATPVGDYPATLAAIAGLVREFETHLGSGGTLGVGTPGALSPLDERIKNANSTVLIGKNFKHDLEMQLGREIRMSNDANCLALSEATDGVAKDCEVVFGVILGTGVGGGIAAHRRVLEGANRIAGEWGHNPLPWPADGELPGPACYCGKHGCIETYLSGPAFSRTHLARSGDSLSASGIAARARAGDEQAAASLDEYLDRLARGLAVVVNILDPDALVFGGGVSNVEQIYERLPHELERYVFTPAPRTKVLRAAHGDSSGVRGAAMLWE